MVFEKFIRYAGLAVGLKPSARGCEGRLRGLYPIMYSKTISPACAYLTGLVPRRGVWGNQVSPHPCPWGTCFTYLRERGQLARGDATRAGGPRSQARWVALAMHAAPPHNAAMNLRLFLGGLRPPKPSHEVGGWGNPVSPSPRSRAAPSPARGRIASALLDHHPFRPQHLPQRLEQARRYGDPVL